MMWGTLNHQDDDDGKMRDEYLVRGVDFSIIDVEAVRDTRC